MRVTSMVGAKRKDNEESPVNKPDREKKQSKIIKIFVCDLTRRTVTKNRPTATSG